MAGCQDRDPRLALCLAPTSPNLAPHAVFLGSVSAQRWREESRGKEGRGAEARNVGWQPSESMESHRGTGGDSDRKNS